jgi:hypothetical protein
VKEKERGVPVEKWRWKSALALLMLLGCWRSLLKSEETVRALLHRAIFFLFSGERPLLPAVRFWSVFSEVKETASLWIILGLLCILHRITGTRNHFSFSFLFFFSSTMPCTTSFLKKNNLSKKKIPLKNQILRDWVFFIFRVSNKKNFIKFI